MILCVIPVSFNKILPLGSNMLKKTIHLVIKPFKFLFKVSSFFTKKVPKIIQKVKLTKL
jgi:hypothetical protein